MKVLIRMPARLHFATSSKVWLTTRGSSPKALDRKSTRLNSSHGYISYAVFCLKKKKNNPIPLTLGQAALGVCYSRDEDLSVLYYSLRFHTVLVTTRNPVSVYLVVASISVS